MRLGEELDRPDVLPCPLCHGTAPLRHPDERGGGRGVVYFGHLSGSELGVVCMHCHLRVAEPVPDDWPGDTPKNMRGVKAVEWLERRCLAVAVARWNALPRIPKPAARPRQAKKPPSVKKPKGPKRASRR